MDLGAKAASGHASDNAGKAKGLDAAISAALDGSEEPRQEIVQSDAAELETQTAEANAPEAESTGDDRTSDEAKAEPKSKPPTAKNGSRKESENPYEVARSWTEDDAKVLAELPPEVQSLVNKLAKNLHGGFTRKSQDLSDKARYADMVRSLFNDSDRQQLARSGTDEVGALRYLLGVQRFATQKPVEYVKWAMQNLGVTPDHLGLGSRSKEQTVEAPKQDGDNLEELLADPAVKQLKAELAELRSWKDQFEQKERDYARSQYASEVSAINDGIQEFRTALDDSGQLKFPHFDQVMRHMGALMESDPDLLRMRDGPDKLEKAYDMAVWARPDLRRTFVDQERQRTIQEQEKRVAAEKAKKATAVKPAAGIVTSKPKASSLDDAIASSLAKFGL